jgi:tol-pal system protein YbgF
MRIFFTMIFLLMATSSHADSVKERLARLEQRLSSKAYMEMWQSAQQLRNEMRNLRGEIEQQSFQFQKFQQQQEQMYLDLEQRLQRIEKSAIAATTIDDSQDLTVLDQQLLNDPEHLSPAAMQAQNNNSISKADSAVIGTQYDHALQTLRSGHYDNAAQQFKKIVARYPSSDLADNAQYWLAETMYINRDFEAATTAFQQVISTYPLSSKVPDALLKIAFIQLELNHKKEGNQQLRTLIESHPQSSAAKLAQQRLNKVP